MERKFSPAAGQEEEPSSASPTRSASSNSAPERLRFTFCKEERLCRESEIRVLLDQGKSVHIAGFTLIYFAASFSGGAYPAKVMMSAPRRQFREAVQRNRVKRLLRESWRTRKHRLYEVLRERNEQLLLMLSCKTKALPTHAEVEEAVEQLLQRLIRRLKENGSGK